ncbi:hypothetical protein MMC21_001010 [Puttea exsequens]|nr:hypothetical protein [Puttea exsequens]
MAAGRSPSEAAQEFCAGVKVPPAETLVDLDIAKLEAEPQEGPTEYKLHLLLRPRRNYAASSTVQNVSGSFLSKSRAPRSQSETDLKTTLPPPVLAPSNQSRQNRLQHLTTQLLWRLQQSSPYHSSSKSNLILPVLPDADIELSASRGPRSLVPGLEESCGALYEIGVSDDGTFVGLVKDELGESVKVLCAMAFSLGCNVQILRLVAVGDCHWNEEVMLGESKVSRSRAEKLWVAEALVSPHASSDKRRWNGTSLPVGHVDVKNKMVEIEGQEAYDRGAQNEQLRISLTGGTTSGKSSLLGTLSTSTLDNGRGKSRLSLLKHRHEIVSGVTSSLAQELFGYDEAILDKSSTIQTNIVNYASGNVSSWNDIHASVEHGRLIFVTDSAGHPRYRRTTVRGLISWAPHWTLCCVAADDDEDSSGKVGATSKASDILGSAGEGVDLSKAHLELCLKLCLPLVVVITKLDIATKAGLRSTLTKVLTTLKAAGRKPTILATSSSKGDDVELQVISRDDKITARKALTSVLPHERNFLVPIVLTSSLTGSGIGGLHALLRQLPMMSGETDVDPRLQDIIPGPRNLFHVDEIFAIPVRTHQIHDRGATSGTILSGYLRHGMLEVGQTLLIGPCALDIGSEGRDSPEMLRASSFPGLGKSGPRIAALSYERHSSSTEGDSAIINSNRQGQPAWSHLWHQISITSIRNLRLPVQRLLTGQVGTVGVNLFGAATLRTNSTSNSSFEVRRGMVMISPPSDPIDSSPPAYNRFSAGFDEAGLPAWPGVLVIVYIASIRAPAKIVEVKALEATGIADDIFDFDDAASGTSGSTEIKGVTENDRTEITFEFVTSLEWFEIGTQVLVTPGGGPSLTGQPEQKDIGSAGLDGYVGIITQATTS